MADYLRAGLQGLGLEVLGSPAPIVSFKYGRHDDMQALQRRLFDQGIYVVHATNYVGSEPEGTIRCAIFRDETVGDIDALVSALG